MVRHKEPTKDLEGRLKSLVATRNWGGVFPLFLEMGEVVFDRRINWMEIEELFLVLRFPAEMEGAVRRLWRAALYDAVLCDIVRNDPNLSDEDKEENLMFVMEDAL